MSETQNSLASKVGDAADHFVNGREGPVRVRVYPGVATRLDRVRAPEGAGLVWVHGGSFTHGTLEWPEADYTARAFAARGVTVVSVDYRLCGNGIHWPAPSDDVLDAWAWTLDNAPELAIDPTRLVLGGASAGGNLAVGVILRLIEAAGPHSAIPVGAFLAYPTLHAVQPPTPTAITSLLAGLADPDVFSPRNVLRMYENFLGGPASAAPVAAIPGTAAIEQLRGFPRTIMINNEADELRVSGEAFASNLAESGTSIEVVTEPGTEHGHLNRPEDGIAERSIDRVVEWLNRQ
ncbi:alpha/beta hydrolase [Arthrobacter bambusae]|uniref:Acetyl esterase/lipase n=1 Tax=Arthrobacter bambusae TaxID=1338426 RepID=A0AAW8DIR2_9MICC|nr:alpha/beta hydrolase fold domain-containing protein [Arthrobacter bambusae]MDP9905536.1 acetyl esterase/lipase [Arthrobacter bambusae]MDQ0127382.1 acetyl esterase/lipase [Arthrobacter bambusae]MDQ0178724.1 acetyl esterase/lipase [Arthrobacter bambusae]